MPLVFFSVLLERTSCPLIVLSFCHILNVVRLCFFLVLKKDDYLFLTALLRYCSGSEQSLVGVVVCVCGSSHGFMFPKHDGEELVEAKEIG